MIYGAIILGWFTQILSEIAQQFRDQCVPHILERETNLDADLDKGQTLISDRSAIL